MSRTSISRKGAPKPTELLTRSRIEIATTLDAILRDHSPLADYLENGEQLMIAQLLHVDANRTRVRQAARILGKTGTSAPDSCIVRAKVSVSHCPVSVSVVSRSILDRRITQPRNCICLNRFGRLAPSRADTSGEVYYYVI